MLCKSNGTAGIARCSFDARIRQWKYAYKIATFNCTYAKAYASLVKFETSQRDSQTLTSMPAWTAATSSLYEPEHVS